MSTVMTLSRWTTLRTLHPALAELKDLIAALPRSTARSQLQQLLRRWGALVFNATQHDESVSLELNATLLELREAQSIARRLAQEHRLPINQEYLNMSRTAVAPGRPPPGAQRFRTLLRKAAGANAARLDEAFDAAFEEFVRLSSGFDQSEARFTQLKETAARGTALVQAVCKEHAIQF